MCTRTKEDLRRDHSYEIEWIGGRDRLQRPVIICWLHVISFETDRPAQEGLARKVHLQPSELSSSTNFEATDSDSAFVFPTSNRKRTAHVEMA